LINGAAFYYSIFIPKSAALASSRLAAKVNAVFSSPTIPLADEGEPERLLAGETAAPAASASPIKFDMDDMDVDGFRSELLLAVERERDDFCS